MSRSFASSAIVRLLVLLALWLARPEMGWAQEETKKVGAVTLTLVADATAIAPGKPFTAGVRFQIDKEWDIYWQFVGDIGLPTSIEWELPEGFKAGPLQWPIPVAHEA